MTRRMLYLISLSLLLGALWSISAGAQSTAPKPSREGRIQSDTNENSAAQAATGGMDKLLKSLELSPAQTANLQKLRKEYAPKVQATRDKLNKLLAEQQQLVAKGAKEPNKLLQVDKDITELKDRLRSMQVELRAKFMIDLTPQQRDKLKEGMEKIKSAR
jgi:Spy/CpxP family protein refolding chaperone